MSSEEVETTPEVKEEVQDVTMESIKSPVDPNDDSIVSEVPVFLSTKVRDNLLVLQYPTRKKNTFSAETSTTEFRIKPQTQFVETDVSTGIPSQFYDQEKTEKWGELEKQSFGGILKKAEGRYAIARLDETGLYISPVSRSAQLRPQFNHFNQQQTEEKEISKLIAKDTKPASAVRTVQMSAKATGEQAVKYSEVAEYWKDAAEEKFDHYPVNPAESFELLSTDSRAMLEVQGFDDETRFDN